jgi:ABC-2 type transport system ATP-binding protein
MTFVDRLGQTRSAWRRTMLRRLLTTLTLVMALAACHEEQTGPRNASPDLAFSAADEERGPPGPYDFGRDSRRTHVFTGQGITPTGLDCGFSTEALLDCRGFLASALDRARLDVTVQVPRTAGSAPYPLVVLVHGYAGSKTSSGDVARQLNAEGYAVLRYSTRGFGQSWGQVNMTDLGVELADLRSMISQVVDEPMFEVNADAIAVTGASYGGGHSWLALVTPTFPTPRGATARIRTVVPIAPWTDLLYSLIPNGRERRSVESPGGLKLSYVNGLYASGIRRNPERPYPNYPAYFAGWHAWINAVEPTSLDPVYRTIVDGLAGYRSIWWQQDFWRAAASARIPILQIQGLTDDLFPLPEAKRMLLALKTIDPSYPIATYLGDLGHPRASNKTGEVDYVLDLTKRWLAFYLKDEGTEPAPVIHVAITRPRGEPFDPSNVIVVEDYEQLSTSTHATRFREPAVLVNPVADPLAGFVWDPFVLEASHQLAPLPEPPASPIIPTSLGIYEVAVAEVSGGADMFIAGQPLVELKASTMASRVQLNVRLFDVAPNGTKQLITRGTYTLDAGTPGTPIGNERVLIVTYGNLWKIPATHRLRLELSNLDSPYISPSRVPSVTTVTNVRLEVPVR